MAGLGLFLYWCEPLEESGLPHTGQVIGFILNGVTGLVWTGFLLC